MRPPSLRPLNQTISLQHIPWRSGTQAAGVATATAVAVAMMSLLLSCCCCCCCYRCRPTCYYNFTLQRQWVHAAARVRVPGLSGHKHKPPQRQQQANRFHTKAPPLVCAVVTGEGFVKKRTFLLRPGRPPTGLKRRYRLASWIMQPAGVGCKFGEVQSRFLGGMGLRHSPHHKSTDEPAAKRSKQNLPGPYLRALCTTTDNGAEIRKLKNAKHQRKGLELVKWLFMKICSHTNHTLRSVMALKLVPETAHH